MLIVNCFFKANEGEYNRALEAAIALTAKSQSHEGCRGYDVFESATRGDIFFFFFTWKPQELLDKHIATPAFAQSVAVRQQGGTQSL